MFLGMSLLIISSSWESYEAYMYNNLYNKPLTDQSSNLLALLYKGSRTFHLIQIIAYNYFIIRLLLQAEYRLNNLFSNLDKYQLRYFYIINISFLIFMSVPGFIVTIIGRTPLNTDVIMLLLVCLLFSTLYIILAIVGLRQLPIEIENDHLQKFDNHFEIPKLEAQLIESQLIDLFKNDRPWLKSNLNIWDVARTIGTNRTYVSHIINEQMGCNFNLFVNNYRVQEAKRILCTKPNLTLTEISEMSGFGSVNSFIRIFKSIENCTPTVYKKNHC